MAEENLELARRSLEAVNRRDLGTFLAMMAADATVQPQLADGGSGRDGIGRWWEVAVGGISDLALEVARLWALDDDVTLAEVNASGKGATSGIPFEQTYWAPARWLDGECIWWGVYLSEHDALRAVDSRLDARTRVE